MELFYFLTGTLLGGSLGHMAHCLVSVRDRYKTMRLNLPAGRYDDDHYLALLDGKDVEVLTAGTLELGGKSRRLVRAQGRLETLVPTEWLS